MPTLVSWGVEVTYNSLFIETPVLLHRSKVEVIGRIEVFSAVPDTSPRIPEVDFGARITVKIRKSAALIASCTVPDL
jgi:hypothetical protein